MTREDLLPQELMKRIPALDSDEESTTDEIIVRVKYFMGNFTWLVAKCEPQGDDVLFYGYVINHNDPIFSEWGCFTLKELMGITVFGSLGVERDLYFDECTFGEYMKGEGEDGQARLHICL